MTRKPKPDTTVEDVTKPAEVHRSEISVTTQWTALGTKVASEIVSRIYRARVNHIVDRQLSGDLGSCVMHPPTQAERDAVKFVLIARGLMTERDFQAEPTKSTTLSVAN